MAVLVDDVGGIGNAFRYFEGDFIRSLTAEHFDERFHDVIHSVRFQHYLAD